MYIRSQEEYRAFIARAKSAKVLAIDTEFMREKSYYPQLCLIQLAADDDIALVDPFTVFDLNPLADLLTDPAIIKVLHAGSQDLEIIFSLFGVLPQPLFDTQIAAALLGYTQQVGYAALVQDFCGVALRKKDSFTDWSHRPLSESQLAYAADDVLYLKEIYLKMKARMEKLKRLSWLDGEQKELLCVERYQIDPWKRYRHLKRVSSLSRKQLAAARELCAWREEEAQRRNIPRRWVLTDEQVVEASRREPYSLDELFMVRGFSEHVTLPVSRKLLKRMDAAMDAPADTWPKLDCPNKNESNVDVQVDLMTTLARVRARENGIAFQTLVKHDDLVALARGHRKDVSLAQGWRYDIVGKDLIDLISGKLMLALKCSSLRIIPVENDDETLQDTLK